MRVLLRKSEIWPEIAIMIVPRENTKITTNKN
jgi:hypothetical protein